MILMFAGRDAELASIRERLDSDRFELIVMYGRRRIGKTRLALEAVRSRPHIYYFAGEADNIAHFRLAAARQVPDAAHAGDSWEAIFNFLRGETIIIDEFPNLISEDRRILSVFQRIVDTQLAGTRTKLILLGSSVSVMGDSVLSYHSPLYGRKTASLKLGPLGFRHLRSFFPEATWVQRAEIYGLSDSVPYYLEMVRHPFWDWLDRQLRSPDGFLRHEVDFLMRYEFEEVGTYKRILGAVASGRTTPVEIRNLMGVRHSDISPYLRNLLEVELIRREVPVTEPEGSRHGRYYLKDNFLSFWFRFIYPRVSFMEEGLFRADDIRGEYNVHMGPVFERIARELLVELARKGELPLHPVAMGRWWRKGEEIDLVCLDRAGKSALLVEVKWSDLDERDVGRILDGLRRKSELLDLPGYEFHHLVVARRVPPGEELVYDLSAFDSL